MNSFGETPRKIGGIAFLAACGLGPAMDTISGFVTAPSSTFTAWTLGAGDSLAIRNFPDAKRAWLIDEWAFNQVAGALRVRSPRMHDNVRGVTFNIPGNSQAFPLLDQRMPQNLYAQDTLIVEQTGSAVGGQIETGSLLLYYEEIPGVNANLTTWDDVRARGVNLFTQLCTCVSGAGGGYTGGVAINAASDLWQANTDYALVGYTVDAQCASVCVRGTDTGNLRISGPGNSTIRDSTRWYFRFLSELQGKAMIPVINAANRFNTTVDVVTNQAAGTFNINLSFVQLAPKK